MPPASTVVDSNVPPLEATSMPPLLTRVPLSLPAGAFPIGPRREAEEHNPFGCPEVGGDLRGRGAGGHPGNLKGGCGLSYRRGGIALSRPARAVPVLKGVVLR